MKRPCEDHRANGLPLGEAGKDACQPAETLGQVLRRHAHQQGGKPLYRFLVSGQAEGPAEELTYSQLDLSAQAIGAWLQKRGAVGERALLLYPPGLEFIKAFLGCLYAKAVAVPAYPPDPSRLDRSLPRMQAIAADSQARFVLTTRSLLRQSDALLPQLPELEKLTWVGTDILSEELSGAWQECAAAQNDPAFLQYTSGSTGHPKGVVVTHRNLMHNLGLQQTACGHDRSNPGDLVCWVPVAHDMGLIMHVLYSLYLGVTCTWMSPAAFIQRPARWLEAISRFKACTSGGPNFSYELCVRKVSDEVRRRLDLSRWSVAWNGAEPVRADTMERFAEAFAPCGFRMEAFYPCWGLAESTVLVSGGRQQDPPRVAKVDCEALGRGIWLRSQHQGGSAKRVVGCGRAWLDQQILIVDPQTRKRCRSDREGEVWLRSPSMTQGYWKRPKETEETFGARLADGEGPYLRTGDLGVMEDGELYITGRLKDVIIIAGLNHYPQDIEQTVVECHPSLRPGCCAAFAVQVEGEEQLAVAAEVDTGRKGGGSSLAQAAAAIRQAVTEEHSVPLHGLALLKPHTIPKTNSGKIQRSACREAFLAGNLDTLAPVFFSKTAGDQAGSEAMLLPGRAWKDSITTVVTRSFRGCLGKGCTFAPCSIQTIEDKEKSWVQVSGASWMQV